MSWRVSKAGVDRTVVKIYSSTIGHAELLRDIRGVTAEIELWFMAVDELKRMLITGLGMPKPSRLAKKLGVSTRKASALIKSIRFK